MFELLGLAVGGILVLFVLGAVFKFLWFLASLILLPLKVVFGVGMALLTGALVLFCLPLTLLAVLALVGGLAFVTLGCLAAAF